MDDFEVDDVVQRALDRLPLLGRGNHRLVQHAHRKVSSMEDHAATVESRLNALYW